MKSLLTAALITLAAVVSAPSMAATHDHMEHAAMAGQDDAALTAGVVKKVDKSAGKLTLTHGPLTNLGMPGMTMAFAVADPALLGKVKAGDKVRFRAEDKNGVLTVVRLDAAR